MKVLIVGAGAVGQIYGYHFSQGGADVSFLVKEKYLPELSSGMKLFPLNQGRNPGGIHFQSYALISSYQELKKTKWDLVVITVASDALYQPWLKELADVINPEASILSLQPGLRDREEICRHFESQRVLTGLIVLIAFATPLDPRGPKEKGMAWWMPPLVKTPFDGSEKRVDLVVSTLNRGGFPSRKENLLTNPSKAAYGSTFLGEFIYVLQKHDWKLSSFHEEQVGEEFVMGLRNSFWKIAQKLSIPVPGVINLLGRRFYSILLRVAQLILPFELERYLQVHFTKVGAQMKLNRRDLELPGK